MINKKWIIVACLCMNFGTLSYAFASNSMNNALNVLLIVFDVPSADKSFYQGMLTSSLYMGAFFGAIVSTFILKLHLGLQLSDICLFCGQCLQTSSNITLFFIGRFLSGIGSGLQSCCGPTYIRQLAPTEMYSLLGGFLSSVFSFGYLMTMFYGTYFQDTQVISDKSQINPYFWRIYFFSGGIPSLIRLILMSTIYNFESPVYYIRNQQEDQALNVIRKIYSEDHHLRLEIIRTQQSNTKTIKFNSSIFTKQFKFGLFLMFSFQFSGFNAVVQYSTLIFQQAASEKVAQLFTLFVSILKFLLYTLTCTYTINRFGRRKPILIGVIMMFIANTCISFFSFKLLPTNISNWLIVIFIFTYIIGNFSSTGPIIPVYLPEIVESQLIPICYWTFWLYSIIILQFFPIAREKFGMEYCFAFFSLITLLCAWLFYLFGVETLNKSNEQISRMFRNNSVQEESLIQNM